jgi:hypothetical protein
MTSSGALGTSWHRRHSRGVRPLQPIRRSGLTTRYYFT